MAFQVNENTIFLELKQMVYEKTNVNPNRYDLDLVIRIDTQKGGNRHFSVRYPITYER